MLYFHKIFQTTFLVIGLAIFHVELIFYNNMLIDADDIVKRTNQI